MWLSRRLAGRYVLLSAVLRVPLLQSRKERVQVPDHTPGSLVCVRVCVSLMRGTAHTAGTRGRPTPPTQERACGGRTAPQPSQTALPPRASPLLAAGSCPAPRTASRPPVHAAARPSVGAHSLPASSSRSGGSSGSSLTSRSSQPMMQPSPPAAAAARGLGVRQRPRRRRRRRARAPLAHEAVTHPGPAQPRAAGAPPRALGGRAVGRPFALSATRLEGVGLRTRVEAGASHLSPQRIRGRLPVPSGGSECPEALSHPSPGNISCAPRRQRVVTCIK